jgi:hypothetical protein
VRPPPQGWNSDPEMQAAERELYARDYLFKPAKAKNTNTLMKAWGLSDIVVRAPLATSISSRTKSKAPMVTRAQQLFMDKMLVDEAKRKPKKK